MRDMIDRITGTLQRWEVETRPIDPQTEAILAERWRSLPESVRVPGQMLGRKATGCEATRGVFPKCNFSCRPCYHSAEANKVRIDGPHTRAEVERQFSFFRAERGWGNYAQLIGGEVSLLDPEDHAASIAIMRGHGRIPMSFTHGDFDYDYLRAVAVDHDDRPRFPHLSFAAHIDTTMTGRRSNPKPAREIELDDERGRFCELFARLEREYGITSYLAHNMTVTLDNLDQVADVIRSCHQQGWRMFSFQPAAYIGNERRWRDGYRELTSDGVWGEIEAGAGSTLPYQALRLGDLRCNRVTWGLYLGDRYTPLFNDADPRDHQAIATWLDAFPGNFIRRGKAVSTVRYLRSIAAVPRILPEGAGWARRLMTRAGGPAQAWWRAHPVTFVMHRFIDAADTAAAWDHIEAGTRATEPRIAEAQERLEACAYSMAHPADGRFVPACVQHGVLDPEENRELAQLLPLPTTRP